MLSRFTCCCFLFILSMNLAAQVSIHSTPVNINFGSFISITGNVSSDNNIEGEGKIILSGGSNQSLDLNSNTIRHLEINNPNGVTLSTAVTIAKNLNFVNGKISLNDVNLILSDSAIVTGSDISKFIMTDGNGEVVKSIDQDLNNFIIPIGNNSSYRPIMVNTTGNYNNAAITVKSIDSAISSRPLHIQDHLKNHWTISQTGITGNLNVTTQYDGASDVEGNGTNLNGYFFDGNNWTSYGSSSNNSLYQLSIPVSNSSGVLYGMNSFVYVGSRAMLQGAYNPATGLMEDKLRSPVLYLPYSDPYATTEYSSNFQHINHSVNETVSQEILNNQNSINDNIVDWVFLELRNQNATGNNVLATRSALIQRDGDIVDTDGYSPVTFNYITDGYYALSIRHRNHLAMTLNPSQAMHLTENKALSFTNNLIDFSQLIATQIYGTANGYTTSTHPTYGMVNLLWGGNANGNDNVRFSGYMNDRAMILTTLNNDENNTMTGYLKADLNMDGIADYSNTNSDKSFLSNQVLGNNPLLIIKQETPQ